MVGVKFIIDISFLYNREREYFDRKRLLGVIRGFSFVSLKGSLRVFR